MPICPRSGQLPNQITGSRKLESGGGGTVRFSSMAYTWTIPGGWVGVPRWADPGREGQGHKSLGQLCPLVNKKGVGMHRDQPEDLDHLPRSLFTEWSLHLLNRAATP